MRADCKKSPGDGKEGMEGKGYIETTHFTRNFF
jgi:hypothetical protein